MAHREGEGRGGEGKGGKGACRGGEVHAPLGVLIAAGLRRAAPAARAARQHLALGPSVTVGPRGG